MADLRLIKLSPPTLFNLTYKAFVKLIWQWKLPSKESEQIKDVEEMIKFVQQLPVSLLDKLYSHDCECKYFDDNFNTDAGHVALFVHNHTQQLVMDFDNENFNVKLLLNICGQKIKNLKELKLPLMCNLPENICEDLCNLMPKLQRLDLFSINIGNEAMRHIAKLPLKELRLVCTQITDQGLEELCRPESKVRFSLLELHVVLTYTTMAGNIMVLRAMPILECLDCNQTQLLEALPADLKNQTLNLKKLGFFDKLDKIENTLETGANMYTKATALKLKTDCFTLQVLLTLTKFEKLTFLSIDCDAFSGSMEEKGLVCVRDVCSGFPNLLQLSLRDPYDVWFSSGCFLLLIAMCPKLEKLKFKDCPGFGEEIAYLMVQVLLPMATSLESLFFEHCILITPNTLVALLELPSLQEIESEMFIPKSIYNKYDFRGLQKQAVDRHVKLNVILYEIISL